MMAQAPSGQPGTKLTLDARFVTLPVTVRDKKGQLVTSLTKDDFTLQEDGRPEAIKYFNLDKDLPITVGLLVDTSGSMRNALDQERKASQNFFDQILTLPADKAFLLHFDREVELLQDVTSSKDKLHAALQVLGPGEEDSPTGGGSQGAGSHDPDLGDPGANSGRRRGGGTQLYDAVFLAADELMKKQPGRKAIVLLSDGDDRGSKETLNEAIESAQRAETSVYTIYFKGEEGHRENQGGDHEHRRGGVGFPGGGGGGGWPGSGGGGKGGGGQRRQEEPRVDGKKIMQQIADETGGRFFEAKKKENVDDIYKLIAEELRTQYVLGYTPDKDSSMNGFHKIELETNKKDLIVQTRPGYYADR
ncbi:MAG TPA: VWA domain-containing protein [Acidisarcina sp.]